MTRILPGRPYPLGACWDGEGVNFAVYAEGAERVLLCLFDEAGADGATTTLALPEITAHVCSPIFGYPLGHSDADLAKSDEDSAGSVPKSIVVDFADEGHLLERGLRNYSGRNGTTGIATRCAASGEAMRIRWPSSARTGPTGTRTTPSRGRSLALLCWLEEDERAVARKE